jgi:N-acetylglucosaminyl-diphospho-decaprenol L-rhamnosyltransferase
MRAVVVIPTLNGSSVLADALSSLETQTVPAEVVVVDNASHDGTAEMLRARFPQVAVVRNTRNEGFGRAVNRGVAEAGDADAIILVNNDAVCAPDFVERMLEPFTDSTVGMVAGVLLQGSAPELVDSAGIELDATLRSWDLLWNRPVAELDAAASPVGPCGGAAAYRAGPFRDLGGFDETLFAYWEDVDLALRLRLAGWRCASAPQAHALHHHGATLGAASAAQRRLEAFGRGYVLAKYRVGAGRPLTRLKVVVLDFPVLVVHLLARRELGPIRERLRGRRAGLARTPLRAPLELASVTFREALRRQASVPLMRVTRRLPAHFADRESPLA